MIPGVRVHTVESGVRDEGVVGEPEQRGRVAARRRVHDPGI